MRADKHSGGSSQANTYVQDYESRMSPDTQLFANSHIKIRKNVRRKLPFNIRIVT